MDNHKGTIRLRHFIITFCFAFALLASVGISSAQALEDSQELNFSESSDSQSKLSRLAGGIEGGNTYSNNRFGTSAAVVENAYASSETVIIACGNNFPDALAASGLAGLRQAPVLLTDTHHLDSSIKQTITSRSIRHAIIIGDTASISDAVLNEIQSLPSIETTKRVSGNDRYKTAFAIFASEINWSKTAIVVTGENFADGLSISSYAHTEKAPIFLSSPTSGLSSEAVNAIRNARFNKIIIVGDSNAVPALVENQLSFVSEKTRLAGGHKNTYPVNRYGTSLAVADYILNSPNAQTINNIHFATGSNFPDALSGGPASAKLSSLVLLIDEYSADFILPSFVKPRNSAINSAYALGSSAVISRDLYDRIDEALGKNSSGLTLHASLRGKNLYAPALYPLNPELSILSESSQIAPYLVGNHASYYQELFGSRYSDEYFADKDLIHIKYASPSGSYAVYFDRIRFEGNTAYIDIIEYRGKSTDPVTSDMVNWDIFVEVSKVSNTPYTLQPELNIAYSS